MSVILDSDGPRLFSILASIPGKKSLILDQSLSILISSIASFTQLQDHGIETVKWLAQTSAVESAPSRVLIITRTDVDAINQVVSVVKQTKGKEFTLLLVPRRTILVDQILEREGILTDIDIKVLPIMYIQEDQDIVRVDVPMEPYSSPVVSPAEIHNIAKTLIKLQTDFGQFSRFRGKGANVVTLENNLMQLEADLHIEEKIELEPDFILGECIVLDRSTDYITPLLTQLTYEGLLYETYPITGSILDLPTQITSQERKITLNSADSIFASIRAENFSDVGPKLSETASTLSSELDSRHAMKTTTQLKQFVSRIPNLQSSQKQLKVHIELTELLLAKTKAPQFRQILEIEQSLYGGFPESEIMNQMESLMATMTPLPITLRLLCLWSQIHNGLKQKDHDAFTMKFLQAYGYQYLPTIHRLREAGLFLIRSPATERGRGGWTGFSRVWQSCPDDETNVADSDDTRRIKDISYLYSGYAPLNLRMLEGYLSPERFNIPESTALKVLGGGVGSNGNNDPGRQFQVMMKNLRGPNVDKKRSLTSSSSSAEGKVTVIVFLGGCTATELAGVRYLLHNLNRECLIITKGMTTGASLIHAFTQEIDILKLV